MQATPAIPAPATPVPAFNARAGTNLYRVYVYGEEVFVIRSVGQFGYVFFAVFGLLGALVWAIIRAIFRRRWDAATRKMDKMPPMQLLALDPNNYRMHRSELPQQALEPAGRFQATGRYAARWTFTYRNQSGNTFENSFELLTKQDVDVALRLLSTAMGDALRVDIDWNVTKGRFVTRATRAS